VAPGLKKRPPGNLTTVVKRQTINAEPFKVTIIRPWASPVAATTQSNAGLLQPRVVSFSFLTLTIANWFSFGAFAHFVARFPAQRDLLRRRRWPLFLFYGVPLLVAVGGSWYQAGLAPAFWGCAAAALLRACCWAPGGNGRGRSHRSGRSVQIRR